MNIETFTKLLQLSLSPIAVISSAALLLLSLTNRLGRTIDRARQIVVVNEGSKQREAAGEQLDILLQRSEFLRKSALFTGFSIFLSTVTVLAIFFRVIAGWTTEELVMVFLFLSVACLSISMIFYLLDVSLSLKALKIEIARYEKDSAR